MLSFLKKFKFPFSEIARNFCEWCGLSCSFTCCKNENCFTTPNKKSCTDQGGTVVSDPCEEEPCIKLGVCCINDNGSFLTQNECSAAGGDWLGPDAVLGDCNLGACCQVDDEGNRTGNCNEVRRIECKESKGAYQGQGTKCEGRDCLEIGSSKVDCFLLTSTNACKCGFPDFEEASEDPDYDPNRRWLVKSIGGNRSFRQWGEPSGGGPSNCGGDRPACGSWRDEVFSGFCKHDVDDSCSLLDDPTNPPKLALIEFSTNFETNECLEKEEEFFDRSCNLQRFINDDCLNTFNATPTVRTWSGTGSCCEIPGSPNDSYKETGSWFETLSQEDTLFAAIQRALNAVEPECSRLDCDTEEFEGCERCDYDPEAEDCWTESKGICTACTSSVSGSCYNASTVRLYISIAGNTGGTVYVILHVYDSSGGYDPSDPETYTEEIREYDFDSAGPIGATTCQIDHLEAPVGKCITVASHSTTPPPEPE
jgi:hypothetical protein